MARCAGGCSPGCPGTIEAYSWKGTAGSQPFSAGALVHLKRAMDTPLGTAGDATCAILTGPDGGDGPAQRKVEGGWFVEPPKGGGRLFLAPKLQGRNGSFAHLAS